MSFTLCTSGSAIMKAGVSANTDIIASGSALVVMSDEAEGRIESETRRTWVTNHSGLPTGIKGVLSDVCSSYMGMAIAEYDPTGYWAREWDGVMNMNDDRVNKGLKILKDFKSNELKTP